MSKNILFILFLFFYAYLFSQNQKATVNEYFSIIDDIYKEVTIKYLKTLNSKDDSINFSSLVKEINNKNIEINDFKDLLVKYKFNATKVKLTSKIDSIKYITQDRKDLEVFFYYIDKENLKSLKDVKIFYDSIKEIYIPTIINEEIESQDKVAEEDKKDDLLKFENILILILAITVLILIFKLYNNKKFISEMNITFNQKEINSKKAKDLIIESNNKDLNQKKQEIKSLNNKIETLNSQIELLKKKKKESISEGNGFGTSSIKKILYFRSPLSDSTFSNDHFCSVEEIANTMFKFELFDNDKSAHFEFHADEKVLNHVLSFPEQNIEKVCDYDNSRNDFKSRIVTLNRGKVRLDGDKWVVTQKAKIKFE